MAETDIPSRLLEDDIPDGYRRSMICEDATHAICDCGVVVLADADSHACRWRYLVETDQ